jgi:hypothetical protein
MDPQWLSWIRNGSHGSGSRLNEIDRNLQLKLSFTKSSCTYVVGMIFLFKLAPWIQIRIEAGSETLVFATKLTKKIPIQRMLGSTFCLTPYRFVCLHETIYERKNQKAFCSILTAAVCENMKRSEG